MSFLGKEYILDSQEGFQELLDSFGDKATAEIKKVVVNHKGTVKLVKNGDQYTLITSQPGKDQLKEVSFKSGVEFDDELAGNKAKTVISLNGNKLTTSMKFEEGSTFDVTREFSDSQVVATLKSSNGSSAKRIYKAK